MSIVLDPVRIEKPKLGDGNSAGFMAEIHCFNQDDVSMDEVVIAFCRVLPSCTVEKAARMMLDIHTNGVGTIFAGTREVCELYSEQLNGLGLDTKVV
jgi:ATP-dependent Clp protease adapter protein ClpS